MPRGQRIWPPVFRSVDLPDRALVHARLVPSGDYRYRDDPELADAMDARFADTNTGKPAEAAGGGGAASAPSADASSVRAADTSGSLVRRLTADGLRRAREFLAEQREHPTAPSEPPLDLLYDERCSRPFQPDVWIERRPFRTRREAAEYLAPKLASIRHLVADHAAVWSWLGMFYFADTVRVEDGRAQTPRTFEAFVVNRQDNRSYMLRYRHYLWGSWLLYEAHGETVSHLLDQELTAFGDIAERAFGSIRIFNSVGIIQLMLRLYTSNGSQKRGFSGSRGGLRHLVRVLDQLERTYDVYGMEPDALVKILPDEFRRWDVAADNAPTLRDLNVSDATTGPVGDGNTPASDDVARADTTGSSEASDRTAADAGLSSSEVTIRELVNVRTRIQALEPVSWVNLRKYLEEGSECWEAYVSAHGIPETRLFRDIALSRLADAIQAIGGGQGTGQGTSLWSQA